MERAVKEQWSSINAEQIHQIFQTHPPEEPKDSKASATRLLAPHPDLKGNG